MQSEPVATQLLCCLAHAGLLGLQASTHQHPKERRRHPSPQRWGPHHRAAGMLNTGLSSACSLQGACRLPAAGCWPQRLACHRVLAGECYLLQSAGQEVPLRELEDQSSPGQPVCWRSHALHGTKPCRQQSATCNVHASRLHTQPSLSLTNALRRNCCPSVKAQI